MLKRHTLFLAVVLGISVAGLVGYGACMMDLEETETILGEVPPMPDAGMPELPPELDDPVVDPDGLNQGLPGEQMPGVVPVDPIVPEPPAGEPGTPEVDLPEEATGNVNLPGGHTACGAGTCGPHEVCCHHEGTCYPSTCLDCCAGADDQPRPDETVLNPPVIDPVAR